VEAKLTGDGFLVLSDTYFPGWNAYVDGVKSKIFQADYILRAVWLNQGEHKIEFIYEPLYFKISAYISLIAIIGIGIFFAYRGCMRFFLWRREQEKEHGEDRGY
jgi:uncharacterized membrane protein YfhO